MVDLRIEGDAFNGLRCSIESDNFRMDNEAALYRIDWDSSRVNAPTDAKLIAARWDKHKKYAFETYDKHDGKNNCLRGYKGGWWYEPSCVRVFLNGEYINSSIVTSRSIYIELFVDNSALKRSRMMFRPTNDLHTCNNTCRNGATCEHVVDPSGNRCVCKIGFCGPECEFENTCKNGGTCEYDKTTNSTTCKCSVEFSGPNCEEARSATSTTSIMAFVGGVLLLLVLIGCCIEAGVVYKRRQMKNEQEGAAKQMRSLAENY